MTKHRFEDYMNNFGHANMEKYKTNPSGIDVRYIFDWDDYIEKQKPDTLREKESKTNSKLKIVFKLQ